MAVNKKTVKRSGTVSKVTPPATKPKGKVAEEAAEEIDEATSTEEEASISQQVATEASEDSNDWGTTSAKASYIMPEIVRHSGEFDPNNSKILVYGESGSGKTRFSASFPNCLVLDCDHGMSSVDWEVDTAYIETWEQLVATVDFLRTQEHNYQWVVLDTLNEAQNLAMKATIANYPKAKGRSYGDLPNQADYGKMLHDFLALVKDLIAIPNIGVVLTSQVNTRTFETDAAMPQLIGKNSAREICRKMDVIGFIYGGQLEDQEQHSFLSFAGDNIVVKDRSHKLGSVLVDPNADALFEHWSE